MRGGVKNGERGGVELDECLGTGSELPAVLEKEDQLRGMTSNKMKMLREGRMLPGRLRQNNRGICASGQSDTKLFSGP